MTDIDKHIIELLKCNTSLKDISVYTNLSCKQIYIRLKNIIKKGYQIKPFYHYDGNINYKLINGFSNLKGDYRIQIPKEENIFKFLVISDMHLTNKKENLSYIDNIYNYAVKNDIHTILNLGDLIEGTYTTDANKDMDINDQIEYVIKKYPYDKSIINYILYGNHDYHSLHMDGIDIATAIQNYRYDLVSLGYGDCNLNLKEEIISLNHKLCLIENKTNDENSKICLVGHGHEMKTKFFDNLVICVPSLSDVSPDKTKKIVPGALEIELDFKKSKIRYILIKHLLVYPNVIECSQVRERFDDNNKIKVKNYKNS